ncbi:aminoglycoside phosphotransferase family protein [Amycolatopsis sp. WGS_07]|uniref:aminoglycoside phosphotransferase family protein n=1 Tax=Amycolatopsis sp. WGS_07 TaxID=3076764 RepID=UPI00387302F8
MRPLPHGYTNDTVTDGVVVTKTYAGPHARRRLAREKLVLTRLQGRVPVPPVLGGGGGALRLGFVGGAHGQDLIEAGHADSVLRACGSTLRRIHALGPRIRVGRVLVHGDFGPNNVLFDEATFAVTAVLDWEFAHLGDPLEDLAWCEWIVRMHHPDHVGRLEGFYATYGRPAPPWPMRQEAMLAKCQMLEDFCRQWEPGGDGERQWRDRAAVTAGWTEL